ncbi:MAG: DUF2892 domain-containing protein [Actinomycetia bacterium]|nr:DUF2892 domain-containing protein [Actinomycetes bacterium]
MSKNEAGWDRGVRVGIAVVAAVVAGLVGFGTILGLILLAVTAIMLVTAAVGFCPLYRVFGVSTCPVPANETVSAREPAAS